MATTNLVTAGGQRGKNSKTTSAPTSEDKLIGVGEAAITLGLSRARVKQLVATHGIGRTVAGRFLFSPAELAAFKKTKRPPGRPKSNRQ